jgi:thioredoxin-dependent peroxiredoxin
MPYPYPSERPPHTHDSISSISADSLAGAATARRPTPPCRGRRRYGWTRIPTTDDNGKADHVSERLQPGDVAPDFELPDADGAKVSLAGLRGKRVILYFYPAAMTPGCTKEAIDFRDNLAELASANIAVIGISPDKPEKLAKFRDRDGLTFPLLSDTDTTTLQTYGAYGEKKLYGKVTVGVIRSTFLIDPDGKVEKAYYNVKATGHVARLRKDLGL